ncbi:alpha/beta hydrolase [Actinomadura rudentiformis]|uniref:Esterase family protein n=1 Tax=Actinomadura rudentiformis TaxID=359158 RepID=A0A6H9YNV0_9ACTN|nr:alpha/beta hydrolase-fold protein [Actinomadura rudentiformis]KAB2347855.1 esterase family protein [Actinomadura rudentiformis]
MQLTSTWLVVLSGLLAVVVLAVTLWVLPKIVGGGIKRLCLRAGLLFGCQVAIVIALATAMNSYFIFYGSWSDLLGTGGGDVGVKGGRSGAGGLAGRPLPRSISPLSAESGLRDPAKDGVLEQTTIRGERTGLQVKAFVYLPPQYFQPAFRNRRFPVSLVLAGYPGDPRGIIERQEMVKLAARDIKSGALQPMVYVITRTMVAPPRDTQCTDVPSGPQAETFFSQDVPQALSNTYRLARDARGWGVMGQSAGGYCSVKLAMLHSDRFAAGASLGGYLKALKDPTTGDLYGGSDLVRNDNDLIWRLEHLPPPPTSVLLASSKVEEGYSQAQRFLALAKPPLRVDTLFPDVGGHNYNTFRRLTPGLLGWMNQRLQADV